MAVIKSTKTKQAQQPHPCEPSLDELFSTHLPAALKSGDERKVYAIEAQIKRRKNV